jgi:hypothetical protein
MTYDKDYFGGYVILGEGEPIEHHDGYAEGWTIASTEGTCATCGEPCKRGTECRRCAVDHWRVGR